MEILAIILFLSIFLLLLYGFPVAFTLGGLSILYAVCFLDISSLSALPPRFLGIMSNYVLLAVPLFVFMGIMLEKSGIAEQMLKTMAILFGKVRGGLAISVVIVGALLAASTGIVGATVVTMGLISLPTMLKQGYSPELATGTISASGTLGQIIPPSIVLILLGSVMNVPVGDLFQAAIIPGISLVGIYILYIILRSWLDKKSAPPVDINQLKAFWAKENVLWTIIKSFLFPFLLIFLVLGSIIMGIATPTEAAGVGALGAIILSALLGKLNFSTIKTVSIDTMKLTSMIFFILLGATCFSFVFRALGGDEFLIQAINNSNLEATQFLLIVMLVMFIAGFFIDFIEIIFILVPVVVPVFIQYDINLIWVGILIALNLQTSFLTPPFGFALFYLKGVAPPEVETSAIYRGVIPFVIIQVLFVLSLIFFPQLIGF
ncbi:MAG: TRAP transporter large permease subunit [Saprospiraceae bacterium]|nr:TRAP transporter large permease subunit [Saprospiraceae bacterium]